MVNESGTIKDLLERTSVARGEYTKLLLQALEKKPILQTVALSGVSILERQNLIGVTDEAVFNSLNVYRERLAASLNDPSVDVYVNETALAVRVLNELNIVHMLKEFEERDADQST